MSYQDIARGGGGRATTSSSLDPSRLQGSNSAESLLLKLANQISVLKKLVDALGGARDTVDHRHRIADTNNSIQELARHTKDVLSRSHGAASSASPDVAAKHKKLLQDFATLLQDYKATQKVAQEREAASLPKPGRAAVAAAANARGALMAGQQQLDGTPLEDVSERAALLQAQQAQQHAALDAEMAHNDALIEEREVGIRDIVHQIGEVNEMMQDLAVLIHDQGIQVRTVDEHITTTAERAKEGSRELVKAQRSQRAYRNKCLWLWLVAALVVSIIIILVLT